MVASGQPIQDQQSTGRLPFTQTQAEARIPAVAVKPPETLLAEQGDNSNDEHHRWRPANGPLQDL
jgi:hypothetical protein